MDNKLRIGIIGVGQIGQGHMDNYKAIPEVELVAIADVNASHARRTLALRADTDLGSSPQAHWVAALQGRVPLLPTAELALNTMLISEAIYLSERLGREVTAEEVVQASVSTAVTF